MGLVNKIKSKILQGKIKENEELKKQLQNQKEKIREKIEEWDDPIKWNNADDHYYAIKILKELLEEE